MTPFLSDNNNNLYAIDYKRLILLLLPTFLRKSRIFALCSSLASGISEQHDLFSKNRIKNLDRLKYNGQVCYLRKLLNDNLDNTPSSEGTRRITITEETMEGEWVIIYDDTEMNQTFIHTLPGEGVKEVPIVWNETKIEEDPIGFTVNVPWTMDHPYIKKLHKLLNEYKLIGQKYNINYQNNE